MDFFRRYTEVIDYVSGKGNHNIKVVFPLHPDVIIVKGQKNKAVLDVANNEINVEFDGVGNLAILEI